MEMRGTTAWICKKLQHLVLGLYQILPQIALGTYNHELRHSGTWQSCYYYNADISSVQAPKSLANVLRRI